MNIKKKNILMIVAVLFIGACIAGGTYAYLSQTANVTNGAYSVDTHCFLIDYNINNVDNTQDITGTLFSSSSANKGLSGRVGMKTNASCNLNGTGTLTLHINGGNATSSTLTTSAASYCEDRGTLEPMTDVSTEAACTTAGGRWRGYSDSYCENTATLERMINYTTSSACTSNGGTWVTGGSPANVGSPLKYAVYNNAAGTGTPLSKGKITSSDIGGTVTLYDNFTVNATQAYYYIFIWLDGYMTDNNYVNLPFSGYISAEAVQN